MAMALISKDEMNPFEIGYVSKYHMGVKTPETSLAKSYEEENRMEIELEIPKAVYQEETVQTLLDWIKMGYSDNGYYRELALHITETNGYERTIAFTHAEVNGSITFPSQEDYVKVEMVINQKADKQVGVAFGEELEETLAKAWDRVNNPPRLNIFVPVEEEVLAGPTNNNLIVGNNYSIEFYLNGTTKSHIYDEKIFKLEDRLGKMQFVSSSKSGTIVGQLLVDGMVSSASYGIKTYDGFYIGEVKGTTVKYYKYVVSVSASEYLQEDFKNLPNGQPVYLRNYTGGEATGITGYVNKNEEDVYFNKANAEKLLKQGFGFESVTLSGDNAICKIKNPNGKLKNYRAAEEIEIPLSNKNYVTLKKLKSYGKRGIEETEKISDLKWESGKTTILKLKAPIYNLRSRIGRFYDANDGGHGGNYTQGNLHLYLNENTEKHLKGQLSENFYKDFDYGKAVVFNGLYNKSYISDSDVKIVEYTPMDAGWGSLQREPIEYEQYSRGKTINANISRAISLGLGAAGAVSIPGLAGHIITLLGVLDTVGVTSKTMDAISGVKDPTDIYLLKFADTHEDSAYYNEKGRVEKAELTIDGKWTARITYVKNKNAGVWVPVVCTYYVEVFVRLVYNIYVAVNGINDTKAQLLSKRLQIMSPHFRKNGWETEQAKVVYSQFDGRYVFWDHENSPAREVKVLPNFINEGHSGMTLKNFENTDNFVFKNI